MQNSSQHAHTQRNVKLSLFWKAATTRSPCNYIAHWNAHKCDLRETLFVSVVKIGPVVLLNSFGYLYTHTVLFLSRQNHQLDAIMRSNLFQLKRTPQALCSYFSFHYNRSRIFAKRLREDIKIDTFTDTQTYAHISTASDRRNKS